MNASALVRRMTEAGATPESIAIAFEAIEAGEERETERKAKRSAQKRKERATSGDSRATVARQGSDKDATVASETLPEVSPKDNIKTPSLPSQSSLRSDLVRLREQFDRFMAIFPKRTNRKAAWAKFQIAAKSGVDPERMIAAAGLYAAHVRFTEPQFIKAPDAWLHGAKYDDELPTEPARPPPARAGPNGHRPRTMTELARMEFPDEPSPSPQTEPESPEPTEPTVLGFAGRLSQPDRDQPGGKLLDLGQVGARWRA